MVKRNSQHGGAELVPLIVVAIVALLAAAYFWSEWSASKKAAARLNAKLKTATAECQKLGAELKTASATLLATKQELDHLKKDPVLFADRFTADTVGQAWQVVDGEARVVDGCLELESKGSATVVCRVPLRGDYQIEYDARVEAQVDPNGFSDLSCFLGGEATNTLSTGYFVGFGCDLNKTFRIARASKDVAKQDAPAVVKEKVPYHVRVTCKGGAVSLYYREIAREGAPAGKEIAAIEFQDPDPLGKSEARYFGLYVWGSRSRFSNIRVTPLP